MVGRSLRTWMWPCSRCCYRICIRPLASFVLPITQSVAQCSRRRPFIIARQNINRFCPCTCTCHSAQAKLDSNAIMSHGAQRKVTIYNCQTDAAMQGYIAGQMVLCSLPHSPQICTIPLIYGRRKLTCDIWDGPKSSRDRIQDTGFRIQEGP